MNHRLFMVKMIIIKLYNNYDLLHILALFGSTSEPSLGLYTLFYHVHPIE